MVTNDTKPVPEEAKIFSKAWDHPKTNSCMKWQEAIHKEFMDMNKQQVSATVSMGHILWHVGTARYPELISPKTNLQ